MLLNMIIYCITWGDVFDLHGGSIDNHEGNILEHFL